MPIYEYACSACDHRTDILHGINDPGPHFCPSCGREGTMRKLFAPPTIHYKGSGWAKKDRGGSGTRTRAAGSASSSGETKGAAAASSGDGASTSGTGASEGSSSGGSSKAGSSGSDAD